MNHALFLLKTPFAWADSIKCAHSTMLLFILPYFLWAYKKWLYGQAGFQAAAVRYFTVMALIMQYRPVSYVKIFVGLSATNVSQTPKRLDLPQKEGYYLARVKCCNLLKNTKIS